MSQVSYGTITITDTNDIESIVIEYNKNQDNQNPPSEGDSNWSTNRPTWQQGYYIWQRTRIHKSGTTTTADIIGTPVCVTGSTGEQGQPGTAGRSLTKVKTEYCIYGTGTPSDSYNKWQDTIPEYNSSTPNYWVKVTNTYSSAPTTEVVKYKDTGITNAMAKAADAQSKAATAETNAANALSLSQATQQHFWFNSVKTGNIEAGAYITDVVIDSFKPNKSGNYLLAGSNGIELGNGSHPYMQLTASELNFFHPNSSNIDAQLSSNGLIVKSGGIEAGTVGQNGGIYLSTENYGTTQNNQTITINSHEAANWRQIIGTKFGVDSDGVLYAGGANIQGKITVTSGSNVYTTDEVNPLNVGGRNLLITSALSIGNILNSSGEMIEDSRGVVSDFIEIEPNTNYILQYWLPKDLSDTGADQAWSCKILWYQYYETSDESETEFDYINGYDSVYFIEEKKEFRGKSPTNATHCRVCFKFPASYNINLANWSNGYGGYAWKLEQGNIATDWTLAPEDNTTLISQQDFFLLTDNGETTEGALFYYLNENNELVSQAAEWSVERQIPDRYNTYVWWKYSQVYSNNQVFESTPVIFNSVAQDQFDKLQAELHNQQSSMEALSNQQTSLNNQYNNLSANYISINNELDIYRGNITIDPDLPMIKVYSRTATEESSVEIYSSNVVIKGGGNSTTQINSEALQTSTIVTTTIMPRMGNNGKLAFLARQNGHFSLKIVQ